MTESQLSYSNNLPLPGGARGLFYYVSTAWVKPKPPLSKPSRGRAGGIMQVCGEWNIAGTYTVSGATTVLSLSLSCIDSYILQRSRAEQEM